MFRVVISAPSSHPDVPIKYHKEARMKNAIKISLVLVLLFLSFGCAKKVPVYNIEKQAIVADIPTENIEKAILKSGIELGWKMYVINPGVIKAVLHLRSHVAQARIDYSKSNYSITYLDSENLDYEDGNIHGSYNRWIRNLDLKIQSNLFGYAR